MTDKPRDEIAKDAAKVAGADRDESDAADVGREHDRPTVRDEQQDVPGGEPEQPDDAGGPGGMEP